ncbi:yeats family-domain-containing protein [Kickxella alabastrina]|uniref:yeats family-domain-containing protein n=1 Tax=Kickxella alabastrina TaxID=61397 RepID=UPI00221F35EC|nr:yeats family-domain-containing protein [Kickxella alabastrina]KAI7833342.1 yeats family-domain-containing protein [Kickxella alabastrina]
MAQDSRFHVIRRAILGNTSRTVAPAERPPEHVNSTHKWTVYLRAADPAQPLAAYVRRVRVFLHPSYRPDDIVDLAPPSFELTRWGWGEFPVRLQVFFRDRRNKPVDLIHILRLDAVAEAPIDFELDRRGAEDAAPEAPRAAVGQNPVLMAVAAALCRAMPLALPDALPFACPAPESAEAMLALVPPAAAERWTWAVAVDADVWCSDWPLGKRLASEAARNRELRRLIADAFAPNTGNMLFDTVFRLLRSAEASKIDSDRVLDLVRCSPATACAEAAATLACWAAEHRPGDRPLRSKPVRESQQIMPLMGWLRANSFVPMPVLNSGERQSIFGEATADSMFAAEHTDGNRQATAAAAANSEETPMSVAKLLPPPSLPLPPPPPPLPELAFFFCNTCGALASRPKSDTLPAVLYCNPECKRTGCTPHTTVSSVTGALAGLPSGWDVDHSDADDDALLMVDDDASAYEVPASTSASNIADVGHIAASLRAYHLAQQDERTLANDDENNNEFEDGDDPDDADDNEVDNEIDDQAIDWIWSAIRPLELNCAPASRFSNALSHNANAPQELVQLPNCSDEAFGEALDQRLVVGRVLLDVTKMFLRDLISASDKSMRKNRVAIAGPVAGSVAGSFVGSAPPNSENRGLGQDLLMLTPLHVLAAVKNDPDSFDICSNAYLAADVNEPNSDYLQ